MNDLSVNTTTARKYAAGIGKAVADHTINRKIYIVLPRPEIIVIDQWSEHVSSEEVDRYCQKNGYVISHFEFKETKKIFLYVTAKERMEEWEDVALRVAKGNTLLHTQDAPSEFLKMHYHLRKATLLMSGRHLQHGDDEQATRNVELFINCATSAMSFLKFYLLLNGCGVGRAMDDELMVVDYGNLPIIVPVIESDHADVLSGEVSGRLNKKFAFQLYQNKEIHYYEVPDSREGWAKAIEKMELMAYQKKFRDDVLILDFTQIRKKGSPIKGMQNRPAPGPGPVIMAIEKIARIRETQLEPWQATMFVDHFLGECVLIGGARRSARMATKTWRDPNIFDFITIKRDGVLWSSNNSVTVDSEFWTYVRNQAIESKLANHARKVFDAIAKSIYYDGTGEPGMINQDKLTHNETGIESFLDGNYVTSKKYKLDFETIELTRRLAQISTTNMKYHQITNPCGEVTLNLLGGYCVIADVVPYHAKDDDEACDAFATATKALMRVNLMDGIYKKEILRTNRIGVGITGFHEWAWKRFGYGWYDIIDENKSMQMWQLVSRFKRVVKNTAREYAKVLGQVIPHTDTTIKPAGTTSKLFGITEGAHLPSMREYLRWVQYQQTDSAVNEFRIMGYPIKKLSSYSGVAIIGFPTRPLICTLGMGEKLVTAAEATPREQYQYLRLLEKYWLCGVEEDGVTPLNESGNQISYTLKYDPEKISYDEFIEILISEQSRVRCCSLMPSVNKTAYEYQPEEAISHERYQEIVEHIQKNRSHETEKNLDDNEVVMNSNNFSCQRNIC